MEAIIWLVTYKGQTESAYTWSSPELEDALRLMERLRKEYPEREWDFVDKDVS